MYKEFFALRANPFNATPDPRYLFLTGHAEEALACLSYGIDGRKGFVLLTGEVGTGKTTLVNKVLERLRHKQMATAFIFNPRLSVPQFLNYMMADFGLSCESRSKSVNLRHLNDWLLNRYRTGETAVLIVDEAQNLSDDLLAHQFGNLHREVVAGRSGRSAGTGAKTQTAESSSIAATDKCPRQDLPARFRRNRSLYKGTVTDRWFERTHLRIAGGCTYPPFLQRYSTSREPALRALPVARLCRPTTDNFRRCCKYRGSRL